MKQLGIIPALCVFLLLSVWGFAQEPSAKTVRLTFLPPPLEGTISLGIYDHSGRLVRVLHREADVDDFEIGHDALNTTWDGKGDDGQPLPAGMYHARGYAVGDLPVEGIGFFFNDWVTDARPERIEKLCTIAAQENGVDVSARVAGGASTTLLCDQSGAIVSVREDAPGADCEGPEATELIASAPGKNQTRWTIERLAGEPASVHVKQYSKSDELLRNLTVPPDQPQPRRIAASLADERIFLLEESAQGQQLRGLSLLTTSGGEDSISDWKVDFEKKITKHKDFGLEEGKPVVTGGVAPVEKLVVKLRPNDLQKDARASVELTMGHDTDGSYLQTADGLPLTSISETKNLTRFVLAAHGEKAVDVFQDDGAAVEQFRVTGLDQMMAFDCGEIELK